MIRSLPASLDRAAASLRRAAAGLALILSLAGVPAAPAPAQGSSQGPAGGAGAAAEAEGPLPDPAAAPPAPARLGDPAPALPSSPAAPPPRTHLPGLETLPDGAWRLRFAGASVGLPAAAAAALAELGRRLAVQPEGRFTVLAQASGPAADVSAARRLSLARGLAVKEALVAGGLPATRIDIRPMGRSAEALDAVDVLPPEVQRPAASPAAAAANAGAAGR